ncbi:7128_t:CDS:2 [Diversispora eburnea]|uniref:7128_t:CDS:1 n=1 Tax=Diversispora eburnea TaxID=1213867 RepID=A0A9N9BTB4_9GLOM|nr:7128_t:CDS:2 [Diversispora eburnea]
MLGILTHPNSIEQELGKNPEFYSKIEFLCKKYVSPQIPPKENSNDDIPDLELDPPTSVKLDDKLYDINSENISDHDYLKKGIRAHEDQNYKKA